jgi:hypothetical protein
VIVRKSCGTGGVGGGHGTVREFTFLNGNFMVVINWEQEFIRRRIMSPAKRVDFVMGFHINDPF